jgi:FAD/FMN-containing dehydrogenase
VSGERKAKFVVFVKSPQDVAAAIKYATSNQLPIAVRGGGHNAPGASSSEDGLVIDLSKYLNTTRIDTENQVAYVGGGATWKTVNHEAGKHQMAAVGATISDCGVGG